MPTPKNMSIASARSSGSFHTRTSPAQTEPPMACSPLCSACALSRRIAHGRSFTMHSRHTARNPAETSSRLATPMCSTSMRVSAGPDSAPMVPPAPM